jgi:hypothetical protein
MKYMAPDIHSLIHDRLSGGVPIDMTDVLRAEYGVELTLVIELGADPDFPFADVRWTIEAKRMSRFLVSAQGIALNRMGYIAARIVSLLPLVIAYHEAGTPLLGEVNLNIEDFSESSGLSFSSAREDSFLIPDTDFLQTRGYADFRDAVDRNSPKWSERVPTAFWRGSSTGLIWAVGSWQELPRIRLSEIGKTRPDLIDAGISNIVQIEHFAGEIEAAGLMRSPVPASEWGKYRYQIDVDGNSNAWAGFFQRLLTGSPVLKAASPFGFRQWFYHHLQPWVHYVPIAADFSDLIEKIEWLNAREQLAELIGRQGQELASAMTYGSEMAQGVLVIAAAIASRQTQENVAKTDRPKEGQSVEIL